MTPVALTMVVVQVCIDAKNSSTAESRLSPPCEIVIQETYRRARRQWVFLPNTENLR